jgi:hypothetical protein
MWQPAVNPLLLMLSVQDTHFQTEVEVTSVYTATLQSRQRGWSVIPLIGGSDAQTGKRPAVRWEGYQRQLPALTEITHWFADSQFTAYGNVCGMISGLVVLDLDDRAVQLEFEQHFPNYMQTFTIQSGFRKTAHLYFNVDFKVKTCKVRGGDLKGEGSYVVGPGSTIGGQQWEVIRDLPLLTLQPDNLEQILSFLALAKAQYASSLESATPQTDFAQLYRDEVARTGERNNALFDVTLKIRDAHLSQ